MVLKLFADGTYQWHTFYGSTGTDYGSGIAMDGSGNVYVSGFSGSTWKGPNNEDPKNAHSGDSDIVVLKLNSNGAYQWHTFYGSGNDDFGNGIAVDGSGDVYVTGWSWATWDGDGGADPQHVHSGLTDIVVLKLNDSGEYQWHTFYGSESHDNRRYDSGSGIALDSAGNVYITGGSYATWDGPNNEPPLHAHSGGGYNIAVLKLSQQQASTFTLTVTKSGTGTGTVNATACTLNWSGNTGTCTADEGTAITLSGVADPGSTFAGWSDGTGSAASCTGTDPCTFTLEEDSGITGTFDLGEVTALKLLAPNGGEVIPSGSTYTIRWEAPSSMGRFVLKYSLDNGVTWRRISPAGQFVTGTSYDWEVPTPAKNKRRCLVKVIGFNDAGTRLGSARLEGVFTIEVVRLTSPNGGETLASNEPYDITWDTNGTVRPVAKVVLSYTLDGRRWKRITTITGSDPGS